MTATTPPAGSGGSHFDGRSFVPDDAPAGESSSPADGNDDGAGEDELPGDEAAPSEDESGEDGADDEEPAGEADGDGEPVADKPTLWAQTPEEKREKRFNDTLTHSQAQAKKLKEYEAKLAKYEKGEGPAPSAAETKAAEAAEKPALPAAEAIFKEALTATDEAKLSENQRTIRRLNAEVVNLYETSVKPAIEAVQTAQKALSDATKTLIEEKSYLGGLKKRAQGREGLYDSEIADAEESIRRLEVAVNGAKSDLVNARIDKSEANEAWLSKRSANRGTASTLAQREAQKHQEAASQADERQYETSERARLATVWEKDVKTVLDELKIPPKLRKAAAAQAFFDVEALAKKRGDKNPVTEAEFKKLIAESIKADIGSFAGEAAGLSDADAADVRARATEQPGPKKRVASRGGDARIPTVEEAEQELRTTLRGGRNPRAA